MGQIAPQGLYNNIAANGVVNTVNTQPVQPQIPPMPMHAMYPQASFAPASQQPRTSVGAVDINIYNPAVNPPTQQPTMTAAPQMPTMPAPYYPWIPVYCGVPCYPNAINQKPEEKPIATQELTQTKKTAPIEEPKPQPIATQTIPEAKKEIKAPEAKPPEVKEEKPAEETKDSKNAKKSKEKIVPLNREYLQSLENHLDSENQQLRIDAVKTLLRRFKEDENRRNNQALTNLLNKALQDKNSPTVRLIAMGILDGGYASGDNLTIDILKNMQNTQSEKQHDKEDALTAAKILLKMSGNNISEEKPETNSKEENKEANPK